MKINYLFIAATAAILTGCAGYNTTMFMTKSNAGLDLDAKPPTAEINISRKEAVIEPVFEKGQTPPVMASFKPHTGYGSSFQNYFLGVDQTFAGGDAAKTMAMLYDSPTFTVGDDSIFDSALKLETPITSSNVFITPAPPGVIRPFIFGTDTQLGLKVAWSGAGGQFPDTVKLGFNRKEFAWAPITVSTDKKTVKMPSFLATIESHIGGGVDTNQVVGTNDMNHSGGISAIQYFATGEAASRLARQKAVRDAMLKRLDPEYASTSPAIGTGIVARQMLNGMETALNQLGSSEPKDVVAETFYNRLQNLQGVKLPVSLESAKPAMLGYGKTLETNVFVMITTNPILKTAGSPVKLSNVTAYMAKLEADIAVINAIKQQLTINTNGVFLAVNDDTNKQPILQTNVFEIAQQLQIQLGEHDRVQKEISSDKDVGAAFSYFINLTRP